MMQMLVRSLREEALPEPYHSSSQCKSRSQVSISNVLKPGLKKKKDILHTVVRETMT